MKNNIKNERIKRRFIQFLRGAKGLSVPSVRSVEKAIWLYEDFSNHEDYSKFNTKKAIAFKKWLGERKYRGKLISATTQYHHLRHLRGFFIWLSGQPGYKSKVTADSISYLSLEKKKVREANAPKKIKYPPLEYVRKLADSIKINTEIDQRDRAVISFLLLSGMRDKAVATLPLGCFDRDTLEIQQFPSKGVDTKFGKSIRSYLFRFDEKLLGYILDWAEYLEKGKLFGSADPLFPRSRIEQAEGGLSFICKEVEPVYWKGTGSIREILKQRSETADLEYYYPHSFRHLAIYLATRNCRTAEQVKAVSQNFGHEHVGTTMMTYGNLDDNRIEEVIKSMDFSGKQNEMDNNEAMKIIKRLLVDKDNT